MPSYRGLNSAYRHAVAVTSGVPFDQCDAVHVTVGGIATFEFKTGAAVSLATIAGTTIPISVVEITGTGTYVALYE
jgi:hypothetical protein